MLTIRRIIFPAMLLAAALSGCTHHTSAASNPAEPQEPQSASAHYPVIVRMVARHSTITISAGPRGPVYSAATSSGKTLVSNATLEELRTAHPDVYRQVEPTLALDARAD
jgi:hypothetical protein